MGLNRNFLMGQNGELKNIKAMMTVGKDSSSYGFQYNQYISFGSLSPNPLPNGVLVTRCYIGGLGYFFLKPESIKSCTINNITVENYASGDELISYLKQNVGKTIPVIFHFD